MTLLLLLHSTSPLKVSPSSPILKFNSIFYIFYGWAIRFYKKLIKPPRCPLRPVTLNNTRPPRITATAGTRLVRANSSIVSLSSSTKGFYNFYLHHPCNIAGSSFRSLSNIPHCCLSKELGPCFSPNVVDHPLRPTKDRGLGEPLPHQLPNPSISWHIGDKIFFTIWNSLWKN